MAKFDPSKEVLSGETADVYFLRTLEILRGEKLNPETVMEVFPCRDGVLCGIEEVTALLRKVLEVNASGLWGLEDGASMSRKEVVLRIAAPYQSYGLYETAICGMLSQASGWATAARECVQAAAGIPIVSFGARHVHPSVAGIMDYAAVTGGCQGCSTTLGAKLAGIQPSGTMPHALILPRRLRESHWSIPLRMK
jgi:nicotinate phosphoribosyltransferase